MRNHTTVFIHNKNLYEVSNIDLVNDKIYIRLPNKRKQGYTICSSKYGYYITIKNERLYLSEIL